MLRPLPLSPRLAYREIRPVDIELFHGLAVDRHVRRYLLDGQIASREWSSDTVHQSCRQFERNGLGLWFIYERASEGSVPIGFAGFWSFEQLGPDFQLLYALRLEHTGKGFATEAAGALVDFARAQAGLGDISAAVDEPNTASLRVLAKLGFEPSGEAPGAFGRTLLFRLARGRPPNR